GLGLKIAVPVFEQIDENRIGDLLEKAGYPRSAKVQLFDGRTGEALAQKTAVGVAYILKLIHMVEDKTHARSTGPYSLVTQQPLGGKAQMGGQRLGEMEVWALEAHKAAHTLQEMLTIKSDDVVGRSKAFEAIVKGLPIPESTVPESFKVLVKELNSLCLSIIPTGPVLRNPKLLPLHPLWPMILLPPLLTTLLPPPPHHSPPLAEMTLSPTRQKKKKKTTMMTTNKIKKDKR
ncbi:hypothetical protein HYU90_03200, partial [Candidatus Collierbacteria bacterium]|nr:hypothetical protein [Candidatus Collierbacteria bacterium]